MQYVLDVFLLLGGIGMFLYGINYMSGGLEKAAGDNLRTILERMTKNGPLAVIVGAFVTALIQSSGATSVMVTGFVNAGLMNLSQALYIMLGANIGTTITAQIIAFNVVEAVAPMILFIGMLLTLFIKNRGANKAGAIILGFGLLFMGIYIMGEAVDNLNLATVISAVLDNLSNPLLAVLFGVLFTAIIQSSSASIGILQVLVASAAGQMISLDSVFYIVLGMNIGACSPVVIVAFAGNRASKRAAFSSLIAKVLGTIFFIIIHIAWPGLTQLLQSISPDNVAQQIANLHLVFNIVSTVLLFPLVKPICALLMKMLPDEPGHDETELKLKYLTPETILNPAIAIVQAKREIMRMANLTIKNLDMAVKCFFSRDDAGVQEVVEREKTINFLNHQITGYLVQLNGKSMDEKSLEKVGMMFHVVNDIERVGDHAENIAEYADIVHTKNVIFTEPAYEELRNMCEETALTFREAIKVYEFDQFDRIQELTDMEEHIDDLHDIYIENHISRLKMDQCDPQSGVMFTDMVTDLERIGDHAINIAYAINGENSQVEVKKTYVVTRGTNI